MQISNEMLYRKCGNSGLYLSAFAFGLWNNFGLTAPYDTKRELLLTAIENGITHIDGANNYGPPAGGAELFLGEMLKGELKAHRDELIISTKAGYDMWPGRYGTGGSRKYLMASLNQSMKRMNLDYLDIFYHHTPDANTPLEETAEALADMVKQGKVLYIGISNYDAEGTKEMAELLGKRGVPLLINQLRYNMLQREAEDELLPVLQQEGIGSIAFTPLEQGMLTNKYLNGIPADSRVNSKDSPYLNKEDITKERIQIVKGLNEIAANRGQSLAQMATSWCIREGGTTTAIIGASKTKQILENVEAAKKTKFSEDELKQIDKVLKG